MTTLRSYAAPLAFGAALLALYGVAAWIVGVLPRVPRPGVVAAALTLDLTLLAPLLYYVLLVRPKGWPAITVVPVFLLGLGIASLLLPAGQREALRLMKYLAAPAELLLLGYLGVKVLRTARRFRAHPVSEGVDFFERLQMSLRETLGAGWAADALAFEVGLLYYALLSWRTRPPAKRFAFSCHQKGGYVTVVAGILIALLIEMIALHALLWLWQPAVAWSLTALSIYGVLWLLGDLQAARLRPMWIEADALLVRIGLRWSIRVPFAAIEALWPAAAERPPRRAPGYLNAVLLGAPQYLLTLKEPIVAQGLYGIRRHVTTLGFAVDDPAAFEAALTQRFTAWQQDAA